MGFDAFDCDISGLLSRADFKAAALSAPFGSQRRCGELGMKLNYGVSGYEGFRERAKSTSLSPNEKAGFPDYMRVGQSGVILSDIRSKIPAFDRDGSRLLDIGIGCGELGHFIVDFCSQRKIALTIVDSEEVLRHLPDRPLVTKIVGPFPDCSAQAAASLESFDGIVTYSVLQYVFAEANAFAFVDAAVSLLKPNARLLIGDIPNATMRKRFLVSDAGKEHHHRHYSNLPEPVRFNSLDAGQIDDGVVLGILARLRAAGMHAFIMPQDPKLPMANRREDLLIWRP